MNKNIKETFSLIGNDLNDLQNYLNEKSNSGFVLSGILPKNAYKWTPEFTHVHGVIIDCLDVYFQKSDLNPSYCICLEQDAKELMGSNQLLEYSRFNEFEQFSNMDSIRLIFNDETYCVLEQSKAF